MVTIHRLTPEAEDIFKRLDALELKQKALADELGLEPTKISKARTGERQFKAAEVLKARDWLAKHERVPGDYLKGLPTNTLGLAPDIPLARSADAGETADIIQLDLSVSMGPGTLIDDFVESEPVKFDIALLRRITRTPFTRLRLITGIGSSNEPKFQHNDQFLIDINERQLARLDGYYWITLHGAHALKRLRPLGKGRIQVVSENPDFEPIEVDAEDVRIEGRAIWFARGL